MCCKGTPMETVKSALVVPLTLNAVFYLHLQGRSFSSLVALCIWGLNNPHAILMAEEGKN